MKDKNITREERVNDIESGGGHSGTNVEKKLSFWQRVWNWIKKVLGL